MTGKKTAVFFALLAAALYAVNIPLSKLLEESGAVTPAMLAGLLYCGAGDQGREPVRLPADG